MNHPIAKALEANYQTWDNKELKAKISAIFWFMDGLAEFAQKYGFYTSADFCYESTGGSDVIFTLTNCVFYKNEQGGRTLFTFRVYEDKIDFVVHCHCDSDPDKMDKEYKTAKEFKEKAPLLFQNFIELSDTMAPFWSAIWIGEKFGHKNTSHAAKEMSELDEEDGAQA